MSSSQTFDRNQMATTLRRHSDKILADWETAVRANVSGDHDLEKSLLRNSLPLLLENLANALQDDRWNYHAGKNIQIALEHARQRFHLNIHQFAEVVDEYAELRKVVIANVADHACSTAAGVRVIHEFIDASIKYAGGLFAELCHQENKESLTCEKQALSDELHQAQNQRDGFEEERDSSRSYAVNLEEERRLRSQVVSMLGYDMRAPLTVALLAAQQLARDPDSVTRKSQRLERVIRSIERLSVMIQNMLDADKLCNGQACPIEVSACNISETLTYACQTLTEAHGNRFIAEIPTNITGYWDRAALGRVIENLANNAVKYGSPTAPILLRLKKDEQNNQVELSVHNEGDPVDPQEIPHLFEARFRTDDAGRSIKSGWGLGLASVKAVAEAHGGRVRAASAPGRGTTFYVQIPLDARTDEKT